jgi:TPR repeat protein
MLFRSHLRHSRCARAVLVTALLTWLPDVQAQSDAPTSTGAPATVVVSGTRAARADPHSINVAKDRILNGKSASSCAFMDTYSSARNEAYTTYMSDFGLDDDPSNENERFSMYAPDGDASNTPLAGALDATAGSVTMTQQSSGCSAADRRFAAGRRSIALKDKSFAQAYEAYDRGEFTRALDLFTTAWNKIGYEEAGLMLARLYLYGQGTPQDSRKAVHWLEQVADGRFDPADKVKFNPAQPEAMTPKVEATFMLARIYQRGIGLPVDFEQAQAWYEKAAELGFVPAQDILGRLYVSRQGSGRDHENGVTMLKMAGAAGYAPAAYHLGQIYHEDRDLVQAAAWFGAAARAGHPAAMFAAGRMLDQGEGVPASPAKAIVFYKDAALKGNRDAQFALGTYFYTGEVVNKDVATARKWFEAAAVQGQPDAMFNLGVVLSNGEGGPRDTALAYVWLSLASQAGNRGAADAVRLLGARLTSAERGRVESILQPRRTQ